MTRVAVIGAAGRMGQATCIAVEGAIGLDLVAQIDDGDHLGEVSGADVAVVFTPPAAALPSVMACLEAGVHAVVGTTGWSEAELETVRAQLVERPELGVLIAPNFAMGAVLLMRFATLAAPHYESVEIIEMHHPDKVDAPSGTARHTARAIATARAEAGCAPLPDATVSVLEGARGAAVAGIPVHAVRLRGLVAHEEVLLGGPGEVLTLRHDSLDRVSFMPGVLLGIRQVAQHPGLTIGLEHYL